MEVRNQELRPFLEAYERSSALRQSPILFLYIQITIISMRYLGVRAFGTCQLKSNLSVRREKAAGADKASCELHLRSFLRILKLRRN